MALRALNPFSFLASYWFPLALVVLLTIAIPGFVLFAADLVGKEGDINRWLEDNYKLSHHIPIPWWSALLLLLVPVAIVILYFLKLKRKPLSVPSTFLWKKSIEDLHVNSLLQWLRKNVLLLLQILAVLFLIYGIMNLRFHGRTGAGKHYILMIDNSASMGAVDITPSRLEWGKQEALKEIEAAGDNDHGMVIEFNSSAEIKQSFTNNKGELRSAVLNIKQTQRPTRIEEALALANSLANPSRSTDDAASQPAGVEPGKARTYVAAEGIPTEVHLYSDGRFPDVPTFALGNLDLQFHAAGKPGPESADNLGIVTLSAIRDEEDPGKLQAFVGVRNFRSQPVEARVQLELYVGGELKSVYPDKRLKLPARSVTEEKEEGKDEPATRDRPGEASVTFDLSDIDDRANTVLHAKLAGTKDIFPLDDEAWLVVGVIRKARVLIVGSGCKPLDDFFDQEATEKVAAVTRLSPGDLSKDAYLKGARDGEYDLVIFDRCGPGREDEMPRANTLFIGHPPPPWKLSEQKPLKNPTIKGWINKHPALQNLAALHEIGIEDAFQMSDLPPRTPRLLESERDTTVMLALSRHSFTDLVMTFSLVTEDGKWNTDWPLKPSFPLFLRNVLYVYGNVSDAAGEETKQPGDQKLLRPDVAVDRIEVRSPAGKSQTLDRGSRADFTFGATDQVGVYEVEWNGEIRRSFAVNLLDAEESNLEPKNAIRIGEQRIAAGETRGQPRDLWKWIVLAALLVLLLEWYIYNRRVYI
ncbi:MAG TPA: BatA and WFA domain-containing protein [Gemmataceae bacterium]|nr:BatA and WFA domain-containing protein [Gemmataceae bacterium]